MKPYGLPRILDLECPDLYDIRLYGLKSSKSRTKKHGVIKNSFRRVKVKATARRIWKKRERSKTKMEIETL